MMAGIDRDRDSIPRRRWVLLGIVLLVTACERQASVERAADLDWPAYGGGGSGQRYSPAEQVDRANVSELEVAWVFRTGDVSDGYGAFRSKSSFEATPILADRTLYLCTP